ncbi:hypothetical protein MCUN1_000996 [Malassezia cuniculi]|uniref:PARP-type domain-containing protein n=1 Tax=Malassezia cuniculi TaxID=948313 RepID=A0AAF0ES24_9BASI|nr:hypothetical protein MCUN1_000996 [Malassezia cuniculi]
MPYRVEYASSARAKCKGPQPCNGSKIEKGALRLGSVVDTGSFTSMAWRHWGCTTSRVLANIRKEVDNVAEDLDGFEDLSEEDQKRVFAAFAMGRLPDEDVTPVLRESEEEHANDGEDGEKDSEDVGKDSSDKVDSKSLPRKRGRPQTKSSKRSRIELEDEQEAVHEEEDSDDGGIVYEPDDDDDDDDDEEEDEDDDDEEEDEDDDDDEDDIVAHDDNDE